MDELPREEQHADLEQQQNRGIYFKFRKFRQDQLNFIMKTLLSEFHFSQIKLTNSIDLVLFMNDSGCFPLCFRKDNINKILDRAIEEENRWK